MQPEGQERRKEHSPDEELKGIAIRSLREGVAVDESELRLRNLDGTAGPDAGRVDELRVGAKEKLLAMAGLTPEQAATVLKAAKKGAEAPALVPGAEPEAALQAPEKVLTVDQRTSLFSTLQAHLASDTQRYKDIQWPKVAAALEAAGDKVLYGLFQMKENLHEVGITSVEKNGRKGFRFDSCSKVSPARIRDVDYFKAQNIAREWSGNGAVDLDLMDPQVFEELRVAGIITNSGTWDYLKTPNPGTPENPGLAWYGNGNGIRKCNAVNRNPNGGIRCSLWVPEA